MTRKGCLGLREGTKGDVAIHFNFVSGGTPRCEWLTDLQARRPLPEKERTPKRVLIIESKPILREHLAATLSEAGFSVTRVPDYPEAILELDELNPDMIIIDEVLPGKDGLEACSQLRAIFRVPIVLLGRDSSSAGWARAVEAGADLYLRRPFDDLILVARVKAILRRYKGKTR